MSSRNSPPIYPVYSVFRNVVKFGPWMYFGKVETIDTQKHEGGIIYAINHQNGLMDPIIVAVDIRRQLSYVARADIFQSSFANSFLRSLKMLPIYRQRDKVNTLEKNEETFRTVQERLSHNDSLVIFPEGNQSKNRKIRPLKKGFARMAFQTMKEKDWNTDLKIIPVGITYESTLEVGTKVLIQFGEAINAIDFKDLHEEDEAEALVEITTELKRRLKDICIHIEDEEHYDTIDTLRYILREDLIKKYQISGDNQKSNFDSDKKAIAYFDELLVENPTALNPLTGRLTTYRDTLEKYNIKSHHFHQSKISTFSMIMKIIGIICVAPLYWFGIITHIVPYKLTGYITRSKVADQMFHPTVSFSIGTLLYPIWWLILSIIVAIKFSVLTGLIFLLILPFIGKFSFWMYHRMKEFAARVRFSGLRKNEEVITAKKIREDIIEEYLNEL